MQLGIAGRTAIVCGSSRGLGRACAQALIEEGVDVVLNGRDESVLAQARADLERLDGGSVDAVSADVTTTAGRERLLAACPHPDIVVTNSGGPAPGPFTAHTEEDWLAALQAQMLAPILLVRAVIEGMQERRFGRVVNITSAMVTTPFPTMGLSSGPRTGLTSVMKGLSRAVARDGVTINNLLPERFDTDRQEFMARREMEREGISYEEARRRQRASIAADRLGRPEEFGAACAFLCSAQAGYISGQNLHLDGGSYPALI